MTLIFLLIFSSTISALAQTTNPPVDVYTQSIQPLFNNRCIACHSCLNSPCQLNLQSYEGFQRGAHKLNVYHGTRISAVAPTRLWIDGKNASEWRGKGFFSVNTSAEPQKNLFFQMIAEKNKEKRFPKTPVIESQICPATEDEQKVGMPYAFPALEKSEVQALESWIQLGAPGPREESLIAANVIDPVLKKQIQDWEKFLNGTDARHQLVARYLYEHLFLAHLYFPEKPQQFFQLFRSSTSCKTGSQEIATRRPNDNPGVARVFYCFKKLPGTIVAKTHIPFELSPAKKERFEELFFKPSWKISRIPTYNYQVAENPFLAFADIPVRSRYQFLLDDAQYHVSTFIKGPVCNGSNAVNAIQEQFFVFFINPYSELMAKSPGFQEQAQSLLILPGVWGSDVKLEATPVLLDKLTEHREAYRTLRARWKKELFPKGYALNDIWAGDGKNPNALLTVFRHDDNALVVKGAVGDLPKTVFMLDYPLFERLVYNLVVNFDIFGNVGHQLLTRVYMDLIRMEAEENFLSFLPPEERIPVRKSWYQGFATDLKMTYLYPVLNQDHPTAISYAHPKEAKKEFVEKVLFTLMNENVRGPMDAINWKEIRPPTSVPLKNLPGETEIQLRKIASEKALDNTPYARFFPEVVFLSVQDARGDKKVYSLIHNREHQNISWIVAESLRLSPQEDSLTIREGYWGNYPNMFFQLQEGQIADFVKQVQNIKSVSAYKRLVNKFGIPRDHERFWVVYDDFNTHYKKTAPVDFGYLDLTRYEM